MNDYQIKTFTNRLKRLGIDVTFAANYPWIYFDTINGREVRGTFHGNHGWTAFFAPVEINGKVKFSDRREVFKKVRSMLGEKCSGFCGEYECNENQKIDKNICLRLRDKL